MAPDDVGENLTWFMAVGVLYSTLESREEIHGFPASSLDRLASCQAKAASAGVIECRWMIHTSPQSIFIDTRSVLRRLFPLSVWMECRN